VGGGSFSLADWSDEVLVWEDVSPAVVCEVKDGTVSEEGRGASRAGVGKSSRTICPS
jgi:hypothetical protein